MLSFWQKVQIGIGVGMMVYSIYTLYRQYKCMDEFIENVKDEMKTIGGIPRRAGGDHV